MVDLLIDLAAQKFSVDIEEMLGAPFEELHDVMDPNPVVEDAVHAVASSLGVILVDRGDPWYALLTRVIDRYEELFVL